MWFISEVTVVTEAQMVTEQQQHPAGEDTEAQKMTTEVFLAIRIILSINVHLVTIFSSTHTHPFNGRFSGTTRVSRYQKGKNQSRIYWSKRQ